LFCASSVAAAEDMPICPDRPSKANGTCTVPAGHFQIETSLVDWTREGFPGGHMDFTMWGSSVVKYGLSSSSDVEFGFTPFESLRMREGGISGRASGFGDLTVRLKQRLTGDEAPLQATLIPFAKLPTAKHDLGNGKVEGGLTVPVSTALGKSGVMLTLGPELDLRADADEHGYHAAMAQLVNFGFAATTQLTLSAELWGQWDWDPDGTVRQYSADGSIAYLVNNDLQLDAGANLGLNRNTPDVELYAGVSKRF
jgi:Putative MetA-pathway of phenol degradation